MTSFKNYFGYHFKSTLLRGAVFAVFAVILTFITCDFSEPEIYWEQTRLHYSYSVSTSWSILTTIAPILATVIPVLEISDFKNKRNIDTLFFLPVSRTKMATVHYLNGLCQIFAIILLCALISLINIVRYMPPFRVGMYGLLVLFILLFSWIVYTVLTFAFSKANTVIDGIIFMGLYSVLSGLICGVCSEFVNNIDFDINMSATAAIALFSVHLPFLVIHGLFNSLIPQTMTFRSYDGDEYFWYKANRIKDQIEVESDYIFVILLWVIVAVACTVGFFYFFSKHKAEKIGDISDSAFGYKVLIPLFALSLLYVTEFDSISCIVILIATATSYIIYRRGFRFKMFDIATMGALLVAALGDTIF